MDAGILIALGALLAYLIRSKSRDGNADGNAGDSELIHVTSPVVTEIRQVLQCQKFLVRLGATLRLDGKFGPKTADAWARAAGAIDKPVTFDRATTDGRFVKVAASAAKAIEAAASKKEGRA